tara:strand:- start:13388 stop:13753 length:366 start_codon:yes stop_codon:yes gene_type:complete
MKNVICLLCVALGFFVYTDDCRAEGVRFHCVTPCEVLLGTGLFIRDTGANMLGGIHTTAHGLGEIITAPFRANLYTPQKRIFYYEPPRFQYIPGIFYEIHPPTVTPPVEVVPDTVHSLAIL